MKESEGKIVFLGEEMSCRIPEGGVGFFDSGLGGLTVLSSCLKHLCGIPVYYYGDNARAPYGNLPESTIRAYTEEAFRQFASLRARAAVIACNTATAACADFLRQEYPFPVVGAEPAVRSAAVPGGLIFVLVTCATAQSARFSALCERVEREFPHARLCVCPSAGLAEAVEKHLTEGKSFPLSGLLPPGRPDAVVLGCTHYVFLKEEIRRFYGCPVYDGNEGIARELSRVLSSDVSAPPVCDSSFRMRAPAGETPLAFAPSGEVWSSQNSGGEGAGGRTDFGNPLLTPSPLLTTDCLIFGKKRPDDLSADEKNVKAGGGAGIFFVGKGRFSMPDRIQGNCLGENIRSCLFRKNGQKSPQNEGFFEVFFLGSGKKLNKIVYKQMFVKENRR